MSAKNTYPYRGLVNDEGLRQMIRDWLEADARRSYYALQRATELPGHIIRRFVEKGTRIRSRGANRIYEHISGTCTYNDPNTPLPIGHLQGIIALLVKQGTREVSVNKLVELVRAVLETGKV